MIAPSRGKIVEWGREEAVYRRGVVLDGCVKGVAPAHYSEQDGRGCMLYATSPYVSLESWCGARDLSASELQWLLQSLALIWRNAEPCLLGPGAFFLGPDEIFLDADKGEVRLCVRPSDKDDFDDLRRSARLILEAIDYKEETCVELAYEFYHLCMKHAPSAEDILAVCEGTERNVFPKVPGSGLSASEGTERDASEEDVGEWIDMKPEPVSPEEEKRLGREDALKKLKCAAKKILFAAAVAVVALALLKAGA